MTLDQLMAFTVTDDHVAQQRVWSDQFDLNPSAIRRTLTEAWVDAGHRCAPFDKILVAAAAEVVPPALVEQLRPGGRIVLPLGGEEAQALTVVDKDATGQVKRRALLPVRFGRLETMA